MAPRCFISYARRNYDSYLERFFKNLRDEIVLREDVDADEAIFLDVEVPTGADWESDIGEALKESLACVTIYTPSYFRREYCGKEFQVFLDRANVEYDEKGAASDAKGIFPILWSREKDLQKKDLPPRVARRITYTGKDQHDRYVKEGMRHILRKDPQGLYLDLLQAMADDLVDRVLANAPPPLDKLPDFDGTPNPFIEKADAAPGPEQLPAANPFHLPFFLLTDNESVGTFSLPALQSWLEDLEDEEFTLQIDAAYPSTERPQRVAAALQEAGSSNAQSIVILDPYLMSNPGGPQHEFLRELLKEKSWQGALLLPVPEADKKYTNRIEKRAALEAAILRILGAKFAAPDSVVVEAVSQEIDLFSADLRRIVVGLAKRLVEEGELKRSLPGGGGQPGKRPQIHGPQKRSSRG